MNKISFKVDQSPEEWKKKADRFVTTFGSMSDKNIEQQLAIQPFRRVEVEIKGEQVKVLFSGGRKVKALFLGSIIPNKESKGFLVEGEIYNSYAFFWLAVGIGLTSPILFFIVFDLLTGSGFHPTMVGAVVVIAAYCLWVRYIAQKFVSRTLRELFVGQGKEGL